MRVDGMSVEILCTALRDFRAKSVGAVSKNVFCKNRPDGGARRGACEESGAEVVICHPRSVCAKFGIDRANGGGDKSRGKSVTCTDSDRQRERRADRPPVELYSQVTIILPH